MTNQAHTSLSQWLKAIGPIHFVGVAGSGMSSLARLAIEGGAQVSGSDQSIEKLSSLHIPKLECVVGHSVSPSLRNARNVVYSSAIVETNEELAWAREQGLKLFHRSEFLAAISSHFKTISVAGTHGKSTTSALIAHMFKALGLEPSYVLGAQFSDTGASAHLGSGPYLIIEADESDGSFLNYRPFIGVVTNIDNDHLDFYLSSENIESAFRKYLLNIDSEGWAIVCWDNDPVRQISDNIPCLRLSYGSYIGSEVRLLNYRYFDGRTHVHAIVEHEMIEFELPLLGIHNAKNALAAISVARTLGIDCKQAAYALSSFPGLERRLSLRGRSRNILVYDDYAHNPGKISNCLTGLQDAFPDYKIIAVFQPHRFSRLQHMYVETLAAFSAANRVIVVPVYSAGESTVEDFSSQRLASDIAKYSKTEAIGCESLKAAHYLLQLEPVSQNSVVVTLGAGDVWTVARDYGAWLSRR